MIHYITEVVALTGIMAVSSSVASAQDFMLAPDSYTGGFTEAPAQPPSNLGSFDIVIVPGPLLSGNSAALAAFNRAAAQWEAYISDPIIVTVNADLSLLAPNIIGSASSVVLQASYNTIRNAMVTDAADETDDAVVAFLPTAAQFTGTRSSGDTFSGNLTANKAALKALGVTGLDGSFGAADATISFNSNFSFDYDNSDGVTSGFMDFETVAAHEIGHALGFISAVDNADGAVNTALSPQALDLFRFSAASNPSTNANFTTTPRNFVPGENAIFDDLTNEYRFSTGLTDGDGRQASHWKDDALTAVNIGIMDPTLSLGSVFTVGASDLRALDLIGYDINLAAVPEPSSLLIGALGGAFLLRRRRAA